MSDTTPHQLTDQSVIADSARAAWYYALGRARERGTFPDSAAVADAFARYRRENYPVSSIEDAWDTWVMSPGYRAVGGA